MFVKPSPGIKIRDPDLQDYLPEDGRNVPNSEYWNRRLLDKDVVLGDETPVATATEKTKSRSAE